MFRLYDATALGWRFIHLSSKVLVVYGALCSGRSRLRHVRTNLEDSTFRSLLNFRTAHEAN